MTHRSPSSASASWAARWPRNLVKAGHDVDRRQPQPAAGRPPGRGRRPRRRQRRRGGAATPTSSSRWCRTPRTSRRSRSATDGIFANATPGTLYIDMLLDPPRRRRRAGRGRRRRGHPRARRPGQRRRGGRDRGQRCRSWSAASAADFDEAAADPGRGRQDDRARRPGRLRADRQGGQPADRRRQHRAGRRGDRLPRGVRRGHRGRARGARRRPGRQTDPGPQGRRTCSPASSSPASGSTCTTRTWASSPSAAREAGVAIPLGARGRPADRRAARASGDGGLDHSALLQLVEQLSGRDCTDPREREETDMATDASGRRRGRDPGAGGRHAGLRPARRGDQPLLRRDARRTATIDARAGPARRGRLAHGRGLHPGQGRQHRRLHRHLRARPAPT